MYYDKKSLSLVYTTLLNLLILTTPVLAHGGHGNEFQGGNNDRQTETTIPVDAQTANRIGIKIEPVKRQHLAASIKTTGQIETLPNQQVEVTASTPGKVVKLLVEPGDTVKAGQTVAVIAAPELVELRVEAQEKQADAVADIQTVQANLTLAQENLELQHQIAEAEINQARTEVKVSQEQYDRDRELYEAGALPRRDMLESEAHLAEGKAQLTIAISRQGVLEAENQLKIAQSDLQAAQTRFLLSKKVYQTRLQQLGTSANEQGLVVVTAPIAGKIIDREVSIGQAFEDAGGKLMTLVNDNRLFVSAQIYEKDLAKIQKGQRVTVKVAALPEQVFTGYLTFIGTIVEGETQFITVKAELDNAQGLLKAGMFAQLEVLTEQTSTNILTIPSSAIVEVNGKSLVYLKNGDAFQAVEVTLGETSDNWVEVKTGLFEDDLIVTQRAPQLYAQSLRIVTPSQNNQDQAVSPQIYNSSLWWLVIPTGGILVLGIFWAGMLWGNYRQRRYVTNKIDNHY